MRRLGSARPLLAPGSPARARVTSWTLAAVIDAFLVLGAVTVACGLAGIGDDNGDALFLAVTGAACAGLAAAVRRRVAPPPRPGTGWVFAGIGILWTALVAFGAAVYLGTGTLGSLDDAVVEAAAGFTTTAVTVLDTEKLSRAVLLWRAATSWVGGLVAILVAVVTLPAVLRASSLIGYSTERRGRDLVPNAISGTRRVLVLYSGFTAVCVLAYLVAGLGPVEAAVVGIGTASTGGFTGTSDSLAGYGAAVQAVATAGMLMAGAGVFALWWLARGRLKPLWRSDEMRSYAILAALVAVAVGVGTGAGWGEAVFMSASTLSTTGFAVGEWTAWSAFAGAVLLTAAGIGTMLGSPGGGLRVMRARLLLVSAGAELRRQLDPHAVVIVRRDGETLTPRALDRLGGHQIAYVALVGVGALLLGGAGLSLLGSVWASVSAVSTLGPAVGEVGAFGLLHDMPRPARLALVPLMMGGRMSIPPLLAGVGLALHTQRSAALRLRMTRVRATRWIRDRAETASADG